MKTFHKSRKQIIYFILTFLRDKEMSRLPNPEASVGCRTDWQKQRTGECTGQHRCPQESVEKNLCTETSW